VISSFDSAGAGAVVAITAELAPAVVAGPASGAPLPTQALEVSALAANAAAIQLERRRGISVLPAVPKCRRDLTADPSISTTSGIGLGRTATAVLDPVAGWGIAIICRAEGTTTRCDLSARKIPTPKAASQATP
jgi:hypothetical protein